MMADQLYLEFEQHLLEDKEPSLYFNQLDEAVLKEYPYTMLERLKHSPQSPVHHPEGNVWIHTMMVVDEAAKRKEQSKNPKAFMWAALLHDIGKGPTTREKKGRIVSYDHDKEGEILARKFLEELEMEEYFIQEVSALVRWHMQILFVVKDMPFGDIEGMKRDTDVEEIALLGLCDRLGRGHVDVQEEQENIRQFLRRCR